MNDLESTYKWSYLRDHFSDLQLKTSSFSPKSDTSNNPKQQKLTIVHFDFCLVVGISYNFTVFSSSPQPSLPLNYQRLLTWNLGYILFVKVEAHWSMCHRFNIYWFILQLCFFHHIESFQISAPLILLHLVC